MVKRYIQAPYTSVVVCLFIFKVTEVMPTGQPAKKSDTQVEHTFTTGPFRYGYRIGRGGKGPVVKNNPSYPRTHCNACNVI
jgi:hypothetical protein